MVTRKVPATVNAATSVSSPKAPSFQAPASSDRNPEPILALGQSVDWKHCGVCHLWCARAGYHHAMRCLWHATLLFFESLIRCRATEFLGRTASALHSQPLTTRAGCRTPIETDESYILSLTLFAPESKHILACHIHLSRNDSPQLSRYCTPYLTSKTGGMLRPTTKTRSRAIRGTSSHDGSTRLRLRSEFAGIVSEPFDYFDMLCINQEASSSCRDLRGGLEARCLLARIRHARLYCVQVDKTLQEIQVLWLWW